MNRTRSVHDRSWKLQFWGDRSWIQLIRSKPDQPVVYRDRERKARPLEWVYCPHLIPLSPSSLRVYVSSQQECPVISFPMPDIRGSTPTPGFAARSKRRNSWLERTEEKLNPRRRFFFFFFFFYKGLASHNSVMPLCVYFAHLLYMPIMIQC